MWLMATIFWNLAQAKSSNYFLHPPEVNNHLLLFLLLIFAINSDALNLFLSQAIYVYWQSEGTSYLSRHN